MLRAALVAVAVQVVLEAEGLEAEEDEEDEEEFPFGVRAAPQAQARGSARGASFADLEGAIGGRAAAADLPAPGLRVGGKLALPLEQVIKKPFRRDRFLDARGHWPFEEGEWPFGDDLAGTLKASGLAFMEGQSTNGQLADQHMLRNEARRVANGRTPKFFNEAYSAFDTTLDAGEWTDLGRVDTEVIGRIESVGPWTLAVGTRVQMSGHRGRGTGRVTKVEEQKKTFGGTKKYTVELDGGTTMARLSRYDLNAIGNDGPDEKGTYAVQMFLPTSGPQLGPRAFKAWADGVVVLCKASDLRPSGVPKVWAAEKIEHVWAAPRWHAEVLERA